MTTAIVPAKVAQILPLEVFTTERSGRNSVSVPSGRVATDIELLEVNERKRIARYELRVANDSESTLACYVYAVRNASGERPFTCTSIAVLPFSGVAVTFELPLPYVGGYDRITVEVHGDGIDLSSDTIPPKRDPKMLVRRSLLATTGVIATLVAAVVGIGQPKILAFDGPEAALGGSAVHIAYEARGLTGLTYHVTRSDGSTVAAGKASGQAGSITVHLPKTAESEDITATLEEHNIFGGDARIMTIRNLATPPPRMFTRVLKTAAIRELSVATSHVASGKPFTIHYGYIGHGGTLRLLDDAGSVWALVPISPAGTAQMPAPQVDHPQNFRVAMHVDEGATSSDSEIGLIVEPAAAPVIKYRNVAGAPVAIAVGPFHPGSIIAMKVVRNVADLHVALNNAAGEAVEGFNSDDRRTFALHIPSTVDEHGRFTIVVQFADRNGQETVVIPVNLSSPS